MASPALEKIMQLLRKWRERSGPSVQTIRDGLDYMATTARVPKDVKCEAVDAGGVPAEWITAPGTVPNRVIIHYHGGGWVAGSVKNSREFLGRLSRATKARIISIDYRLGPEHPYPAAVDDAFAAYKWLLSTKVSPQNIIMMGESAGGNLTAVTLLKARDTKLPLPSAAILLSPVTDVRMTGGSMMARVQADPFMSPEMGLVMVKNYLNNKLDLVAAPTVSPIYADLKGFPPLFIQVGEAEILYDHSINFAAKAKKAGVVVEVDEIPDGLHAMALFPAAIPEAAMATEHIAKFIAKFFK